MPKQIIPIRSSTQIFTEIEDIDNDIIMFCDGSCALILKTTAVNFSLLSTNEQEGLIYAYAGLLNSLTFPIQILIRTQQKDISAYLQSLQHQEDKQKNPKLAKSIHDYRIFVAQTVKEKNVLDKKFYIIIPFSNVEVGASPSAIFSTKKTGLPYPKGYIFDRAVTVLSPKRDQIIRLVARIGLKAEQLNTSQLKHLYYTSYNPGATIPGSLHIDE